MPEDTGPLPSEPTVADRGLATVMYLKTPHALVQDFGPIAIVFNASKAGVVVGAPQRYYRAGTPSYTSSECPARLLYCSLENSPSQTGDFDVFPS